MRFRVLGTLEARSGSNRLVRLGAAKQRALLAVLLLNVNRPVHVDRLVEALWPQRPPRTAAVALRTYVSALRRVLGLTDPADAPLLSTVPGGYQMRLSPADLDLLTFEELVAQGQQAMAGGRPVLAAERLRRALGLWRGRPFEDVALDPRLGAELIRLEERKAAAQETWIDAQLALGNHGDLLAELGELVAEQPLRERLRAQWMLALYRSGRQAEALRAYRDLRGQLVRELGVEPSPPLQRLHRQILTGHPDLAPPVVGAGARPGPPPVPRQLPRDIPSFTGRAAELARLRALVHQADRPGAPVIGAIDGMAGVGKTTLAVHAAHRLAGGFADGQVFVDLHGFTQGVSPVYPADALEQLLRSLGVPGEQIPHDLDARAALYRSRLAGKRVLILLDNAAEEAQVRPLLPGAPGCLTLVTSRRRLTGLEDVRPLSLDVLPRGDALALFTSSAGSGAWPGSRPSCSPRSSSCAAGCRWRSASPPPGCGAGPAGRRRTWPTGCATTSTGSASWRSAGTSVTATMDLSYHHLSPGRQGMYRLLGLHPGPDIERHAAAALAGTTPQHASRLLDDLVDAHLLHEPVPGRYCFHDLLRAHATATLADEDTDADRRTALTRLFDHYIHTASAAMGLAHPHEPGHPPPVRTPAGPAQALHDQARAVEWLDAELTNLLATVVHAARHGWPAHALHLSATLDRHLRTRAHYTYARTLHSNALQAVACAHRDLGRHEQARKLWQRALDLLTDLGVPEADPERFP